MFVFFKLVITDSFGLGDTFAVKFPLICVTFVVKSGDYILLVFDNISLTSLAFSLLYPPDLII